MSWHPWPVTPPVAAIIPAAGRGLRLASSTFSAVEPKALRLLGGRSLLERSAAVLAGHVDHLVVAAPGDRLDEVRRELAALPVPVTLVAGGATRQQSVHRALDEVSADFRLVLVHDAARPLVPADVVHRVLEALAAGAPIVVPVLDVTDSLRQLATDGRNRPLDRAHVRAVQTPQGFARDTLVRAHTSGVEGVATDDATDDASLAERLGAEVTLVAGDPLAFKITRPFDLLVAETVLASQA